jgi:hypothetical protein
MKPYAADLLKEPTMRLWEIGYARGSTGQGRGRGRTAI